jgi:hypothetical protein
VKCKDYRAKSNTTLYLPPTLTIKKKWTTISLAGHHFL